MKHILAAILLLTTTLVAQTSTLVIGNGKLTTDLNANTKSILDVGKIVIGTGGTPAASFHILPNGAPTTNAYGIKWGTSGAVLYQSETGTLTLTGDLVVDGTITATIGIVDLAGDNTFTGTNEFTGAVTSADFALTGTFAVANETVRDAVRTALDLVPNGAGDGATYDVQAYSTKLAAIAAITPADSTFLVGNGTTWVAETTTTVRTSLGLGTGDSPTFTNSTLTGTLAVGGASTLTGKVTAVGAISDATGLQFGSAGAWYGSGSGIATDDPLTLGSTLAVTGTSTFTGALTLGTGGLTLTSSGTVGTWNGSLVATGLTLNTTPLGVASGGTGLSTATASTFLVGNGSIYQAKSVTAFALTVLDDADAAAVRTTLELSVAGGDLAGTYPNPTIKADAVALGTDTTGNYVLSLADSGAGSFTITNGVAEGGAVTLALAANGIILNTHTVGDYVATVTAGDGVTITGEGTEARAATISIGQAVDDQASPSFAGLTVTNLTATNFTLAGSRVMVSDLGTNAIGAANSVWGSSNALVFEGSADANETSLTVTDPQADRTITLPDASGTVLLVREDDAGDADTIWGGTNAVVFEGATADEFEAFLTGPTDPTADVTITLPNATTTLVGRDTTDTLTGKTLTSPTLTTPVVNGATSASGNFDLSGSSGTTKTTTGVTTISGGLVGSVQDLSGAGAVDLTTTTTRWTTTAVDAGTLATGTDGQIKIIVMVVDGGNGTLTPTLGLGVSTIVFDDVGDSVILQYHTGFGWVVLGSYGIAW